MKSGLNNAPTVSVIMPTFNRAGRLKEAIKSVLNQTLSDFELIIVNDGSTDNTRETVRKFKDQRIIYIEKKKGGPSSARNSGLIKAKGEYISYLDDDDIYYPCHLKVLSRYLDKNRDTGLAYCDNLLYIESNRTNYAISSDFDKRSWETRCFFGVGNVMHRRECIDKVGLFDENLSICEDWDMWLRISDYFKIAHLPKILHKYIIHGMNVTLEQANKWGKVHEYIIKKRLRRSRNNETRLQNHISESSFGIIKDLIAHRRFDFANTTAINFYKSIKNYQTLACLGICCLAKGNFNQALNWLKKSLVASARDKVKPDRWHIDNIVAIKTYLAKTYRFLGKTDSAIRICREALKLMPANTEANAELSRCYIKYGLIKKALGTLDIKSSEEKYPNPEADNLRGYCYFKMKNYPFAIREFSNAAALEPSVSMYHCNLATAYLHRGEDAKARDEYQRFLKLEPNQHLTKKNLSKKAGNKICNR